MNKYERLLINLDEKGSGSMKVFGNSMTPILKSGTVNTYEPRDEYEVGDIVFSKVRGRFIDAHKITQKCPKRGYLISNNKNFDNGWTQRVFAKVVKAEHNGEVKNF